VVSAAGEAAPEVLKRKPKQKDKSSSVSGSHHKMMRPQNAHPHPG